VKQVVFCLQSSPQTSRADDGNDGYCCAALDSSLLWWCHQKTTAIVALSFRICIIFFAAQYWGQKPMLLFVNCKSTPHQNTRQINNLFAFAFACDVIS
jgi:hypothetical protein